VDGAHDTSNGLIKVADLTTFHDAASDVGDVIKIRPLGLSVMLLLKGVIWQCCIFQIVFP
jgi:hypothetical protein